jgi:hypothetical protein
VLPKRQADGKRQLATGPDHDEQRELFIMAENSPAMLPDLFALPHDTDTAPPPVIILKPAAALPALPAADIERAVEFARQDKVPSTRKAYLRRLRWSPRSSRLRLTRAASPLPSAGGAPPLATRTSSPATNRGGQSGDSDGIKAALLLLLLAALWDSKPAPEAVNDSVIRH